MSTLSIPDASFLWKSGAAGKFAGSLPTEKGSKGLRPGQQSCHGSSRLMATPGFFQRFISELAPDGILATVIAGVAALSLVVVESLSYAALIFSGPLSPYIDVGIAITLNTAVVVGLMTALFGSYPGTIAFSQSKIATLLAFMAAALVSSMVNSVPGDKAALTVAAAIFTSTVITGAVLAGLGAFSLQIGHTCSFHPLSRHLWISGLGRLAALPGCSKDVGRFYGDGRQTVCPFRVEGDGALASRRRIRPCSARRDAPHQTLRSDAIVNAGDGLLLLPCAFIERHVG